jgi:lysophospholipase L1-like esterase
MIDAMLHHVTKAKKKRLFHLMALVLVLSPLVLIELIVRICVPPAPVSLSDPYVSFGEVRPLFSLNSGKTRYEISPERLAYFRPQSFAAHRDPNTLRIFCLGGSTVQGRPYAVETAFSTWLRMNLSAAQPGTQYEMVNCGGVSYASYRLVPIMQEVLHHAPDLIILCAGHNEFLEGRTYYSLKRVPRALIYLHMQLLRLRSYALVQQLIVDHSAPTAHEKSLLPVEVNAVLDFNDGLDFYTRDTTWREGVIEHFQINMQKLIALAQQAEVPLVVMAPVSNLKDSPPFKSLFGSDLSIEQKQAVDTLWERARQLDTREVTSKLHVLEQAAAIDPHHAGLLYLIGTLYEQTGRLLQAKSWFLQAKEQDICPLRMLEPMRRIILATAQRYHVPVLDLQQCFEEHSEHGVVGREWLVDHVHPTIEGHQLIANLLTDTLVSMGLVRPIDTWQAVRNQQWKAHFAGLDHVYFTQGNGRLESLRRWSRARFVPVDPNAQ